MAAAGWNQETKARLSEKVAVNMNDLASLTKHVLRGSKSSDVSWYFGLALGDTYQVLSGDTRDVRIPLT